VANTWYNIKARVGDAPAEVSIYDEIGLYGVSAKHFIREINDLGDIDLTIHSPGGDVADGLAIFNALKRHKGRVTTYVDTLAASMASVVALAGDTRRIADNGFVMVHNPWSVAVGDAEDFAKISEDMRKWQGVLTDIYVSATGLQEDEVRSMMDAETWMTASEAVAQGFAQEVVTATRAAASIKDFSGELPEKFSNWPAALRRRPACGTSKQETVMADNEKLLELQAKVSDAEAQIKAEKQHNDQLTESLKNKDKELADRIKALREDTAKIVALGKEHDQLDLAVKAIAEDTGLEKFKEQLLDAYASGNHTEDSQPDVDVDASREPKSRAEFLETYNSLSGRDASSYWGQYASKHLK